MSERKYPLAMSNTYRKLADGSVNFGSGIIGPSNSDCELVNGLPDLPKSRDFPESDSSKSILSIFDKFPKVAKLGYRLGLPALTLSLIAAVCDGGNDEDASDVRVAGATVTRETVEPFLDWPFDEDLDIKVQQAWLYTDGSQHKGTDFILGEIDSSSTWQPFEVLAAADGEACANPPHRQGNAVFIKHMLDEGGLMYTYYGHLESIAQEIPECASSGRVSVYQGQYLGVSGSSGMDDPGLIHEHFQVNNSDGQAIDPYDIRSFRGEYPDHRGENGKFCGENTLWINCPTGPGQTVDNGETAESGFDAKVRQSEEKAREFIELLLTGGEDNIFNAYARVAKQEEFEKLYPNQLFMPSFELLEVCSEQMSLGGFRNWDVKIKRTIIKEQYEQGERWAWVVGVTFDFRPWNNSYGRLDYKSYNPVNYETDIWFWEFGDELLIIKLPLCRGPGTPLSTLVGQPADQ